METNERLTARVAELEAELVVAKAAVQSVEGASAAVVVEAPPAAPPRLVHALVFYVVLPVLLLVAIHYVLVIRLDAKLYCTRISGHKVGVKRLA